MDERQLSDHMIDADVERAFLRRVRDYRAWQKKRIAEVETTYGDGWVSGYLAAISAHK